MTTERMAHVAVLLGNGLVLIAGGYDSAAALASAELYDPATGRFRATGSMTHARAHPSATLLRDGTVLIAGGWFGTGPLDTAELYDPPSGIFKPVGSMHFPRSDHTATLLSDGRVLLTGGLGLGTLASAEIYDPATRTFSLTGSLVMGRTDHTATLLRDGRVLVAGGSNDSCSVYHDCASAELYDPATGRFVSTGSMAHARTAHTATLLADGRVLIAGGKHYLGEVGQAELYDPTTGRFSPAGSMTGSGRFLHIAAVLPDGRIVMIGGTASSSSAGGLPGLASAEIYYPDLGEFRPTVSMAQPRVFHTATLLPDGHILVAGGADGEDVFDTAELCWP
jgi:hypothetical protein